MQCSFVSGSVQRLYAISTMISLISPLKVLIVLSLSICGSKTTHILNFVDCVLRCVFLSSFGFVVLIVCLLLFRKLRRKRLFHGKNDVEFQTQPNLLQLCRVLQSFRKSVKVQFSINSIMIL